MSADQNNKWRLVAGTAVLAVAATKCIERGFELYKSKNSNTSLTKKDTLAAKKLANRKYDDNLFREQLARNYAFLGEQGMENLKKQYITVVGCGGVGSWVVTMLVRSGCHHIRVIDFDQVSLSSLNRHSCATLEDVGLPKVDVLKTHMSKIAPWCEIEVVNELWTLEHTERLLTFSEGNRKPDWVVDCIDNIDTKVDLLEYLYKNKINMISSMGAAIKSDPSRINIGDISTTEEDSLARACRRRLKKRGITEGIPVVFSSEKPDPNKAQLLPLPEEEFLKGKVGELSSLKDFRVRILPVLGTMPGVFGLTIVSWLLTKIAGYPMEPIIGKNRYKVHDSMHQSLAGQMTRIGMPDQRVPISTQDVPYILEEVFRGKSPISGFSTRLTLSKWDPSQPLSLQNVVIMTREEQKTHEERVLNGKESLSDVYSKEVLDLIAKRFAEEKFYSEFR
ncbi:tRNA threonylcarbamoyladenosine dehydratase [Hanseniaspora vineae]